MQRHISCDHGRSSAASYQTMCRVPYIDGISAFLSFLGFLVSLAYVQDVDVLMWENNMVFTTNRDLISATDMVASTLIDTCGAGNGYVANKTGPYTLFQLKQEWGNNSFAGTSFPVDTGTSYKPWVMLHWILACSCLFQGARYLAYVDHEDFEEGVLFQYDPSSGPDFWRWVEYAVTSPLQIILIAGTFYMREIVLISTMAGLQGALVLLGYVIELEIQTLCLEKVAAWQAGAYRPQGRTTVKMFVAQCKLFLLLSAAYTCHCIIWAVLIVKFQMQAKAIEDCKNPSAMPPEVAIVIGLQCAFFSLFGVVLTVQAVAVATAPMLDPQQAQYMWKTVSWYYSLLSITAKLALEWGFITVLAAMP